MESASRFILIPVADAIILHSHSMTIWPHLSADYR